MEKLFQKKTAGLLRFLKESAKLRGTRQAGYSGGDKVLWMADLPIDLPPEWSGALQSPFLPESRSSGDDVLLQVRKRPAPDPPQPRKEVEPWLPPEFLNRPEKYVEASGAELQDLLKSEISGSTRPRSFEGTAGSRRETLFLKDHPGIEPMWLAFLREEWKDWQEKHRCWQKVQKIYDEVDSMHRQWEEAPERYELIFAVGLVQWRDSEGKSVKRHLLAVPAEIALEAADGILSVSWVADQAFRLELDMLAFADRPSLLDGEMNELVQDLTPTDPEDEKLDRVLRTIGNKVNPGAQVHPQMRPWDKIDDTFRIVRAPALVLRSRSTRAYAKLLDGLLENGGTGAIAITPPWYQLIAEGSGGTANGPEGREDDDANSLEGRLYFPLPTNEEQRKIAARLRRSSAVLVKGPPGTGKSQTIANLICHLLATGERVLVTAQGPRALEVLQEKLPEGLRALCVRDLGSSGEDQRLLEKSVRGILAQEDRRQGADDRGRADRLEKELQEKERELRKCEEELIELRRTETSLQEAFGGYRGRPGEIAWRVESERERYGWIPELVDPETPCPLSKEELESLAEGFRSFPKEKRPELRLDVGDFELLGPEAFRKDVETWQALKRSEQEALAGVAEEELKRLARFADTEIDGGSTFLKNLENRLAGARRVLGELSEDIVGDLLIGHLGPHRDSAAEADRLLRALETEQKRLTGVSVKVEPTENEETLLADVTRRLEHLQNGGRRGWGPFAPRCMKETRYLEESCRVDGQTPTDESRLEKLQTWLAFRQNFRRFLRLLPPAEGRIDPENPDPIRAVAEAREAKQKLDELLAMFQDAASDPLLCIPDRSRGNLREASERERWIRLLDGESARRRVLHRERVFEELQNRIASVPAERAHPCLAECAEALRARDPERWRIAHENRERARARQARLHRYEELLSRLEGLCPQLIGAWETSREEFPWEERLRELDQAWAWSAARSWLGRFSDPLRHQSLKEKKERLHKEIETKTKELTEFLAWQHFFGRLDGVTEQSLKAWSDRIRKLGKGTGQHAPTHRKNAREHLRRCLPKIPAWIMPLHRVWEMVPHEPGVFDTVIIDEASQAGVDSLPLFLLAKRIVVVGDDQQNSPEAVGVDQGEVRRLQRDYLADFHYFASEFEPDSSLFDHAGRVFGNLISLREHFRCVPEIIRFSNELCYSEAPLIPLRQPPPERLLPLKKVFVSEAVCEGEGQRICNRREAEEIAKTIRQCLDDRAYQGKTMGVIVLQGQAHVDVLEEEINQRLSLPEKADRRLRCGTPSSFQGDERDVIFLSMVIAGNHDYRALTGNADRRRFNVAMSRARDQVWLFHSIPSVRNPEDLRSKLLSAFDEKGPDPTDEELVRLEDRARGRKEMGECPEPYESWFEVDVALALLRKGYRLRPQFEAAGYRIDLVIEGREGRLAIECDGDHWHGEEEFDRDMARQRQLERAGWTFVRIRESEFYANRDGAIEPIGVECRRRKIWPDLREEEGVVNLSADLSVPKGNDRIERGEESVAKPGLEQGKARVPFSGYSEACGFPDPRNATSLEVRTAIRTILEKDGPMTADSLYRLYTRGCPELARSGRSVRESLDLSVRALMREGDVEKEWELGEGSPEGVVLRLKGAPKTRVRPAGERDLLEIPPSELWSVLKDLASDLGSPSDDEALLRGMLTRYGYNRLTDGRRRYLAKVLKIYRRQRGILS